VGNSVVSFTDPNGLASKPINPPNTAAEHYARNVLNIDLPKTKIDAINE